MPQPFPLSGVPIPKPSVSMDLTARGTSPGWMLWCSMFADQPVTQNIASTWVCCDSRRNRLSSLVSVSSTVRWNVLFTQHQRACGCTTGSVKELGLRCGLPRLRREDPYCIIRALETQSSESEAVWVMTLQSLAPPQNDRANCELRTVFMALNAGSLPPDWAIRTAHSYT